MACLRFQSIVPFTSKPDGRDRAGNGDKSKSKKREDTPAMNMLPFILQLITGAAGGNIAGALFSNFNLGATGNTLAGIVGGGVGGQVFHNLWATSAGTSDMQIF